MNYDFCKDEWYKILFFYANLTLTRDDMSAQQCMGWLWYIQCDMQMFLLLPILLWIFTKSKMWGVISSFIPVVICVIWRLVYGFYYEFSANYMFEMVGLNPAKNDGNLANDSYFKPWTRMAPYFIAVTLAFVMEIIDERVKQNNERFVLKAWQYWSCMAMAAFIMLSLVVWPYQDVENIPADRWNQTANSFYYALSRPAWVCHVGCHVAS